jgi:nucleoid DNA-binding protein
VGGSQVTLGEIIVEVAGKTRVPASTVKKVILATLEEIRKASTEETVMLHGFGVFYSGKPRHNGFLRGKTSEQGSMLRFRESKRRRAKDMDKYAVEIDPEKVKTSSTKKVCPKCGHPIDPSTPDYCETCGTEPFERRPESKR